MSHNVATRLRRRRRTDPMQAYDALPRPLRAWIAQAVLPWSPASCRRIWLKARGQGAALDTILTRLDRAEQKTLSRDGFAFPANAVEPHQDQKDQLS